MAGAGKGHEGFNAVIMRVENLSQARAALEALGADAGGINIMSRKMPYLVVSAENLQARAAHILKQVMLSNGGECATPREIFLVDPREPVRVIIMGTLSQFRRAVQNLSVQPFGLAALASELKRLMADRFPKHPQPRHLNAGRFTLPIGERTLVMGVINVTPDSFSDGGVNFDIEDALATAVRMRDAGADIIDVGGESTRPGAREVGVEEELSRTIPLIGALSREVELPVSIDTCKAEVARRALDAGAVIINDVSGLRFDRDMIPLAASRGAPVIIMHMQGTPRDMQDDPRYQDVVRDICRFIRERAERAVEGGISPENIMVDPGIGFGKTLEHNLEIMRRLEEFKSPGYPLVVGTSRKSFIGEVLDRPVEERLLGTASTVAFAVARGADVVRVHDVPEMVEVVRMADAMAGKHRPEGL